MIYSKIINLLVQRLDLHQNGVEFCQQFNGAIRSSLTAPYNGVQGRTTSPKNLLHDRQAGREGQYGLYSEVALAKKNRG